MECYLDSAANLPCDFDNSLHFSALEFTVLKSYHEICPTYFILLIK